MWLERIVPYCRFFAVQRLFQKVSVCLECGVAELTIPEKELEVLRTGTPVEGASVWLRGSD